MVPSAARKGACGSALFHARCPRSNPPV